MITYLLGKNEVEGYARDLVRRLCQEPEKFPRIWVTIGQSGNILANVLLDILEEPSFESTSHLAEEVKFIRCLWKRKDKIVEYVDELDGIDIENQKIFVIDSAIHSGTSMLAVCESLAERGARDVISYSLIIKKGTLFVPTFFGVVIQDEDRAYFLLPEIPNNRLMKDKPPKGYIRQLRGSDIELSSLQSGKDSVDNTFGALLYKQQAEGYLVYLYISGNIVYGYVCVRYETGHLFIDTVVADINYQNAGVGTALLRWSETLARSSRCKAIELWSIQDRVDYYKKIGFNDAQQDPIQYDAKTCFHRMRRPILYNTKDHTMNLL